MRPIGFSTGALAQGDVRRAVRMMRGKNLPAIELSALREHELEPLINFLPDLDLAEYPYISVHAPSHRVRMHELEMVRLLRLVADRRLPIILHPDVVDDFSHWKDFGDLLCVENMDKRKLIGRTARELDQIFRRLPDSTLCFDIGHARQVDPTMSQASEILREFGGRLRQLHVSEVNSSSHHEPLNTLAVAAFRRVAHLIPENIPIILESPVIEARMLSEAEDAAIALSDPKTPLDSVIYEPRFRQSEKQFHG